MLFLKSNIILIYLETCSVIELVRHPLRKRNPRSNLSWSDIFRS